MKAARFLGKLALAFLAVLALSYLDGCAASKPRANVEGCDQDMDSLQVERAYFGGGK